MMNRQQEEYARAKTKAQTLDEMQRDQEAAFIRRSGYTNADGSVPAAFWMMDDEKEFSRLCAEFDKSPLNLFPLLREAQNELRKAEDALIDFALAIIPADPRETLNRNRNRHDIRTKILDIAFKLDTRTLK